MKGTHFGVQAVIVLGLVALVSWPEYRPVRAQSIWRYTPAASRQTEAKDLARLYVEGNRTPVVGFGPASDGSSQLAQLAQQTETNSSVAGEINRRDATPISVAALGARLNALIGLALTSLNTPIPYARLALRNIHTARVEAHATANSEGRFAFLDITPSSYVVELLAPDGSVIATSEVVGLEQGDVRQTTVRMAASASTVASAFGNTTTDTLFEIKDSLASSDVTRTTPTLIPEASPNNPLGGTR